MELTDVNILKIINAQFTIKDQKYVDTGDVVVMKVLNLVLNVKIIVVKI